MSAERDRMAQAADHLARIADDLRRTGDIPLIVMSDDGVTRPQMTLADELWTIAYTLDADTALQSHP